MNDTAIATPALSPRWPVWLVFAFLVVLPFGNAFEAPLAAMAAIGLWRLVTQPRAVLADVATRRVVALFLVIWLPMLVALPDAVNAQRSLETVLVFVRFPLAGVFIVAALKDAAARRWLISACGLLLLFWAADGLVQLIFGRDLLGFPYNGTRVSGLFNAKLALGHVLAVASPVVYETLRRHAAGRAWPWLAVLPYLAVIVATGSRAAWVMAALAGTLYAAYRVRELPRAQRWQMLARAAAGVVALGVALALVPAVRDKAASTAGLFSGDYARANEATSLRLPIWASASRMIADHWINGVGPRGFRYAYPQYAAPGDPYIAKDPHHGPTHAHQMLLEILSETGIVGLAGLVAFYVLLARIALRLDPATAHEALPWFSAAAAAVFPLNTGLAFYASFWSATLWWFVLVAVAFSTPPATR
jgi:O-antigen ligase